eukprot:TCONS_00038218-protein
MEQQQNNKITTNENINSNMDTTKDTDPEITIDLKNGTPLDETKVDKSTVLKLVDQNAEILQILTKIQVDNQSNNTKILDIYKRLNILNTDVQGVIKSQT